MRDDLERVLYDAARDLAEFRFGTSIAAIAQQADAVQVTDTRGRAEGYDVVIGADGLHSVVRALAFADAPARTHALGLWSAAFRLPNVLGLHAKFETHMERDRYMVVFTTGDADLAAVFVWAEDGLEVPPQTERRAWLEARYRGAPEVVRAVLGQAPRDGGIYLDPLFQIELPHWSRGRVVLLGDAAHCITLLSGQGASAAFSGASRLARALIEHADPTAAFHQYEAALQPLIATLQPRTRAAAHWYVPRSAWRHWLRDAGLRLLPAAYFEHHFRRKYRAA